MMDAETRKTEREDRYKRKKAKSHNRIRKGSSPKGRSPKPRREWEEDWSET